MKRIVAIIALPVLAGVVSLGALLMMGVFDSAPSASAHVCSDLVVKTGPDPAVDVTVVGEVCLGGSLTDGELLVQFFAAGDDRFEDAQVCVADECFDWVPPGEAAGRAHRCPGYWAAAECNAEGTYCVATIEWDAGDTVDPCGDLLCVQAHAATTDEETAYGVNWKGNFEVTPCCY